MSSAEPGYEIRLTKTAIKDIGRLSPAMKKKLEAILRHSLATDPYAGKKLLGDLEGNWSLRLNLKDRIVYSIDEAAKIVYIKRAKTHYGD